MKSYGLALFVLAAAACPLLSADLESQIKALIARSPTAASAYWGIEIADVSTGVPLFELNQNNFFVPASNTKLLTSALTLSRLGPKFTLETTVQAVQPADPDGVLSCDLILKGAGDPSLKTDDIESLATQVFDRGVRRIEGAVIGDDTFFLWEPYNPGWSIDDAVEGYGAPISALTLNDNSVTLHVSPDGVALDPPLPIFTIDNRIQTDEAIPARIHYERLPGSSLLHVWGAIHARTADPEIPLAVDDPARYAALALLDALQRRGIQVTGKAESRHLLPGIKAEPGAEPAREPPNAPVAAPLVLARHESPPLIEDLRVTEKTSQNLHAETYLRLVAAQKSGNQAPASRAAGLSELRAFMTRAGIDQKQYSLQDGSGLSRLNVITPHALVALLVYMARSARSEAWNTMFAVGGTDGTLEHRMKSKKMKGRVLAKTGSLGHVSALSGYVTNTTGKRYAFSILVNNFNGPAADIRDVIDKICSVLVE
jgi:D-alanyl-D-alanine carboxypeptidase/D-alanyl-D-alanine-endopeptidase (penicillin-binding protein 4)